MRLVSVLFTFENNTGHTDLRTDGRTDERTDTTSYRDATAHLKTEEKREYLQVLIVKADTKEVVGANAPQTYMANGEWRSSTVSDLEISFSPCEPFVSLQFFAFSHLCKRG